MTDQRWLTERFEEQQPGLRAVVGCDSLVDRDRVAQLELEVLQD